MALSRIAPTVMAEAARSAIEVSAARMGAGVHLAVSGGASIARQRLYRLRTLSTELIFFIEFPR